MTSPYLQKRLAMMLPDEPRWVETRSTLLGGWGRVFGLETSGALSFAVADPGDAVVSVVGCPSSEVVREAAKYAGPGASLLCQPESRDVVEAALPDSECESATLYRLSRPEPMREVPHDTVRLLEEGDITRLKEEHAELARYLGVVLGRGLPAAAAIVDDLPVSVCAVGARTETLWDISIDTLEPYRRRGHAASVVAFMVCLMRDQGREPVWGAVESNAASRGLAEKLGFQPVDELLVFEMPD